MNVTTLTNPTMLSTSTRRGQNYFGPRSLGTGTVMAISADPYSYVPIVDITCVGTFFDHFLKTYIQSYIYYYTYKHF